MNAILLLDYLSVRRQQQETYLQILRNEAQSAERSYNLLFSYISHNQRTTTRNSVDEMTGILSSISNLSTSMRGETRRSTPALATPPSPSLASQLRSTMNRSTSTTPATQRWSWNTAVNRDARRGRTNHLAREWLPHHRIFPQTINFTRTTFDETPPPPTQAEIQIATVTCKYQDVSTNQLICPIARTNFEDNDDILKIIHCSHIFKKESLLTWFETKQTCPICRHNITSTPILPLTRNTPSTTPIGPRLPPV